MPRSPLFSIARTVVYQMFRWHNIVLEKFFRHLVTAPYDIVSTWDIPFVESFRRHLILHPDAVERLKDGMDPESCDTIDLGLKRLLSFPAMDYITAYRCNYGMYMTSQEKADWRRFASSAKQYRQRYGKAFLPFSPPEFLYHHGLAFLDPAVKAHLKDGVFIDCGTFNGASIAIMADYAPARIYGFEPDPANIAVATRNLNAMTPPPPFEIVAAGVGDTDGTAGYDPNGCIGRVSDSGPKIAICRIDTVCREKGIRNVRWLKADIEGAALQMIQGAEETIRRDRPMLTLGVYHSPDEFFGIRQLIDQWDLNYHFMMRRCNCQPTAPYNEITLIAFPREWLPATS